MNNITFILVAILTNKDVFNFKLGLLYLHDDCESNIESESNTPMTTHV